MPIHIPDEAVATGLWNSALKDIRSGNMNDEKQCDEMLEIIEICYRNQRFTEEQVRYATRLILSQN
jgi:hypothetical protein